MFESLVVDLLNKHLGDFVCGLTKEQLKIGVFSGKVNLTELDVKPTCLDFLDLPIRVKHGHVGQLSLEANWRKLTSQPVKVVLDRIFVVAGPKKEFKVDKVAQLKSAVENKLNQLATTEAFTLAREGESEDDKNEEGGGSYVSRLTAKIVNNIKVTINHIHIRYEDDSDPRRPVAMGLALENLSAVTTDEHGRETFHKEGDKVHKHVKLTNFRVYCNTRKHPGAQPVENAAALSRAFTPQAQLEDILNPVSGSLNLVMRQDNKVSPNIKVDIVLLAIRITLAQRQYHGLLDAVSNISRAQSSIARVQGGAVAEFRGFQHSEERREYIKLYKRTLNATWLPKLEANDEARLQSLEKDVRLDDLARCRLAAFVELRKELKGKPVTLRADAAKQSGGWGSWFSSKKQETHLELSEQEQADLYSELEYDPKADAAAAAVKLPPDYVKVYLQFAIRTFSLALMGEEEGHELLSVNATKQNLELVMKPETMKATVTLQEFTIKDSATANTLYPLIIGPQPEGIENEDDQDDGPLLKIVYETNPREVVGDARVDVAMRSQQIVAHRPLLDFVGDFFTAPAVDSGVLDWSSSRLQQLRSAANASLGQALTEHSSMNVTLSLKAPTVVLVQDPSDPRGNVLVADLGTFDLNTECQTKESLKKLVKSVKSLEDEAKAKGTKMAKLSPELANQCYDTFAMRMEGVHLFIALGGPNWHQDLHKASLLLPMSLDVRLGMSIAPNITCVPSMRVDGTLPVVQLDLSVTKYQRLMGLANALSAPPSLEVVVEEPDPDNTYLAQYAAAMEKEAQPADAPMSEKEMASLLGSEQRAKELMAEIDVDGDGTVTVQEFYEWWDKKKSDSETNNCSMQVNMKLEGFTLTLNDDTRARPAKIMTASILGIGLGLNSIGFDQFIGVTVDSVTVQHLTAPDKNGQQAPGCRLLHTSAAAIQNNQGKEGAWLNFRLVMLSKLSPVYEQTPIGTDVKLDVGLLEMELEAEALRDVGEFVLKRLLPAGAAASKEPEQAALPAPAQEKAAQSSGAPADSEDEEEEGGAEGAEQGSAIAASGKCKRDVSVAVKAEVSLGGLAVRLRANQTDIGEVGITDLGLQFSQYPLGLVAAVQLGSVSVKDLTAAGATHPWIAQSLEQRNQGHLVELKYATYHEREEEYPGFGSELSGRIHGMRVCFLNRFVQELLLFVSAGPLAQLQASLADDGDDKQAPASLAVENKQQQQQQNVGDGKDEAAPLTAATFTKISVSLGDMEVLVPRHSRSEQVIAARLDSISVDNSLETDDKVAGALFQRFKVVLSGISADSAHHNDNRLNLVKLGRTELIADLLAHRDCTKVVLDQTGVKVSMAHVQYSLVMGLLSGNLAEGSVELASWATDASKNISEYQQKQQQLLLQQEKDAAAASAGAVEEEKRQDDEDEEPQKSGEMDVQVCLRQLEITLLAGDGRPDEDALLMLSMNRLDTALAMAADGAMGLDLTMQSLLVEDVSPAGARIQDKAVLTPYKRLVSLLPKEDGSAPLTVGIVKPGETAGTTRINVNMSGLNFSLAGVLMKVGDVFVLEEEETAAPVLEGAAEVVVIEKAAPAAPKAAEEPAGDVEISVELEQTSVMLPSDPTSDRAMAIVLVFGLEAGVTQASCINTTKVTAGLADVRILHRELRVEGEKFKIDTDVAKASDQSVIAQPFGVRAEVWQYTSLDEQERAANMGEDPQASLDLTADVDHISMRFTWLGYQTVMQSLNALSLVTAQDEADEEKEEEQAVKQRSLKAPENEDNDEEAERPTSFGDQSLRVLLSGVTVTFVNDVCSTLTPLAKVELDQITANIASFGNARSIAADFALAVRFFNNRVAEWEPMLEPARLSARIQQELTEEAPYSSTRLLMTSDTELDVNFSAAMLEGVNSTVALLTAQTAKKDAAVDHDAQVYDPYMLDNQTPFDVEFFRHRDDGEGQDDEARAVTVASGQSLRFGFQDEDESVVHHSISAGLVGAPKGWSRMVLHVSKVGVNEHSFDGVNGDPVHIVCEVSIELGVKVLTIRSALCVRNETTAAIQVVVGSGGDSHEQTVDVGAVMWVNPLMAGKECSVALMPSEVKDGSGYSRSAPLAMRVAKSEQAVVYGQAPAVKGQAPWAFALCRDIDRERVRHQFVVRPRVVVHNTLPQALEVSVAKAGSKYSIDRAQRQGVHVISLGDQFALSLCVPSLGGGASESLPLPLPGAKGAAAPQSGTKVARWLTEAKKLACVHVEWSLINDGATLLVTAFTPYWLFDMTDLGLTFRLNKHVVPRVNDSALFKEDGKDLRTAIMCGAKEEKMIIECDFDGGHYISGGLAVDTIAPGTAGQAVILADPKTKRTLELGLQISLSSSGSNTRTKFVSVAPRFVVENRLGSDLQFTALGMKKQVTMEVRAGKQAEMYTEFPLLDRRDLAFKRIGGGDMLSWQWSGYFNVDQAGKTRMGVLREARHQAGNAQSPLWYVSADVRLHGATTFIVIEEPNHDKIKFQMPYRFTNASSEAWFRVRQVIPDGKRGPEDDWVEVAPGSDQVYALQQPALGEKQVQVQIKAGFGAKYATVADALPLEKERANTKVPASGGNVFLSVENLHTNYVLAISDTPMRSLSITKGKKQKKRRAGKNKSAGQSKRPTNASGEDEPVSQYRCQVVGVEGITNIPGIDITKGRVVCAIECPQAGARMAAVVREVPLATKLGGDATQAAQDSLGAMARVHMPVELDVPEQINWGAELLEKSILQDLSRKQRFALEADEALLYHVDNSNKFQPDATLNCVLLTNKRLVQLDKGINKRELWLDQLAHVTHESSSALRWDHIVTTNVDGQVIKTGIFNSKACAFFVRALNRCLSPLARAKLASKLDAARHGKQGGDQQADIMVLETLQEWTQDMSWFVADFLQPSLKLTLLFYPEPTLEAAPGAEAAESPCAPVTLAFTHVPVDQVPQTPHVSAVNHDLDSVFSDDKSHARKWFPLRVHPALSRSGGKQSPVEVNLCLSLHRHKALAPEQRPMTSMMVKLPAFGLSLVDNTPQELMYISLHDTRLEIDDCEEQQTLEFKLGRLQVDNQLFDAQFPVVLAPTPVDVEERQPMVQLSLHMDKDSDVPVQVFQYASFLMQAIDVKADEALLHQLVAFGSGFGEEGHVEHDETRVAADIALMSRNLQTERDLPVTQNAAQYYFKTLHIQPLKANIWFSAKPGLRGDVAVFPLSLLLGVAGSALGNIDDASIRLTGLMIEDAIGDVESLMKPINAHYLNQIWYQVLPLLGSFEILGNPIGLVENLGSGVKDFFYEPAKGLVKSPQDFGKGLAKGSASLLSNTFSGVFGAASKTLSSVSKGVGALSMDEEFASKKAQQGKEATNAATGFMSGLKSLGGGVVGGITGVFVDPLKGAKKDGLAGFGKGLMTGIVGVVAKPISGAVDLGSQTLKGIGNTPAFLLQQKLSNSVYRPQRYIDPSGRLKVYDAAAAQRQLHSRTEQASAGTLDLKRTATHAYATPDRVLHGSDIPMALRALMRKKLRLVDGERVRYLCPTGGRSPYPADGSKGIVLTGRQAVWFHKGQVKELVLLEDISTVKLKKSGLFSQTDEVIMQMSTGESRMFEVIDTDISKFIVAQLSETSQARRAMKRVPTYSSSRTIESARAPAADKDPQQSAASEQQQQQKGQQQEAAASLAPGGEYPVPKLKKCRAVKSGRDITTEIYASVAARFNMRKNEKILFFVSNGNVFQNKTDNCVFVTNQRVVKLEGGKLSPPTVERSEAVDAQHQQNGPFRWDKIHVTLRSGERVTFGVDSKDAGAYLTKIIAYPGRLQRQRQ